MTTKLNRNGVNCGDIKCFFCSKQFTKMSPQTKYCSFTCYTKARLWRNRKKRRKICD